MESWVDSKFIAFVIIMVAVKMLAMANRTLAVGQRMGSTSKRMSGTNVRMGMSKMLVMVLSVTRGAIDKDKRMLSITMIVLQTITTWMPAFTTSKMLANGEIVQIMSMRLLTVDVKTVRLLAVTIKLFAKGSVLLNMAIIIRIQAVSINVLAKWSIALVMAFA